MAAEAEVIDIGRGAGEAQANAQALEKELKEFSGGLPYDQARIIERTQDGLRQGVHGFYLAGLGMILLHENEGETYPRILEQYFPGITYDSAKRYMKFARAASILPNFKQFCLASGGYSKGLTMLESCSGEEMAEFESTGELRGYTQDQVDRMSVRQLKQALRRAKEKAEAAVQKATEKLTAENAELKTKVDELSTALATPDLEAAKKLIKAAETKIYNALELLRKVDWELVSRDWTLRLAVLEKTGHIGSLVGKIEANIFSREMPEPPAGEGE